MAAVFACITARSIPGQNRGPGLNKPIDVKKSVGNRHVRLEFVGNGQVVFDYNGSNTPVVRNVVSTTGRYEIIKTDEQPQETEYIDRIKSIYHFETLWTLVIYSTEIGEGPCLVVKDNDTPKF
jgi:hypothetical protein